MTRDRRDASEGDVTVGVEVSPGRPIARLIVDALAGHAAQRSARLGPYVPPLVPATVGTSDIADLGAVHEVRAACERLLRAILTGEDADGLEASLDSAAVVWSPVRSTSTRAEFAAELRTPGDGDTLTEVEIEAINVDVVEPRVYLEWRLSARFSHACFIDDDLMVEPTQRLVEAAGALVVTMSEGLITAAHCYYDDFALLEQVVAIA
jgi:hypothetical protein